MLFSLTSPDGDQTYTGGTVNATPYVRLSDDNRVVIEYRATTDKPCPVNLTNRAYFNLEGDLKKVALTNFGPCTPKTVAKEFLSEEEQCVTKGYDHTFLLKAQADVNTPAACLRSTDKQLQISVYTSARWENLQRVAGADAGEQVFTRQRQPDGISLYSALISRPPAGIFCPFC